jgi:hypothetical protein
MKNMKYHEGIGYGEVIRDYRERKYGPGRRLRLALVAVLVIATLYAYIGVEFASGSTMFVPQ